MILRYQLPRMIVRNQSQTLDADIYSDAGVQQTPSAGASLTLYEGSGVVLDAVDITEAAPSTYPLLAATTSGKTLSTRWLELWVMTIDSAVYSFRREAYLVRQQLFPTITDTDLTTKHDRLNNYLGSLSNWQTYRDEAWVTVQRRIINAGRRPQLVLDSSALRELHIAETLAAVFRSKSDAGVEGRFAGLAEEWSRIAAAEWSTLTLQYDDSQDGTADEVRKQAASPVVMLTARKSLRGTYGS